LYVHSVSQLFNMWHVLIHNRSINSDVHLQGGFSNLLRPMALISESCLYFCEF